MIMSSDELLPDVKNYLDITWDDPDGDKKLDGIIKRGRAYIGELSHRQLVFEEGTFERFLLFEYCLYANSGALSEFAENYKRDLITFREREAVMKHWSDDEDEEKTGDTDV